MRAELERQIEHLGLMNNAEIIRNVADPRTFYATAGVFAFSSESQSTAYALFEASAARFPCILTEVVAAIKSIDGIAVPQESRTESLVEVLHKLCASAGLVAKKHAEEESKVDPFTMVTAQDRTRPVRGKQEPQNHPLSSARVKFDNWYVDIWRIIVQLGAINRE